MFRGTLVIDQADSSDIDVERELLGIAGPKILATRRLFRDPAAESRCLTRRMPAINPRRDVRRAIGASFWQGAEDLRNKLLCYRLRNHRQDQANRCRSQA